MKTNSYSFGPTIFRRMSEDLADANNLGVGFSGFLSSLKTIAPMTAQFKRILEASIAKALDLQLPLYVASYMTMAQGIFPDVYRTLSILLIMRRESNFNPTLIGEPTKAFGLMMILPSAAKWISGRFVGSHFKGDVSPIIPYFKAINQAEGVRLEKMFYELPLSAKHPFDQVLFLAEIYIWHNSYIDKLFQYVDGRWTLTNEGIKRVKNKMLLQWLADPAEKLWNSRIIGRHMLNQDAWLHGPGAFTRDIPLVYRNATRNFPREGGLEMAQFLPSLELSNEADKIVQGLTQALFSNLGKDLTRDLLQHLPPELSNLIPNE